MNRPSERGRLPVPDLDDRTWADLVEQMRALIPRYAPSWTDQGPGDLGITLVELFAWLGESVIYRLNQTPEKNYLAFLRLLDITRDPPSPALVHLTFTSGAGVVVVPAGTQAQTPSEEGLPPVVFETDEDVLVQPTVLRAALVVGPHARNDRRHTYADETDALVGPPTAEHLLELQPGEVVQLCLGFDAPAGEDLVLRLRLHQPLVDDSGATVDWVRSDGTAEPLAWPGVTGASDGTDGLRHDGTVRLPLPATWTVQRAAGPAATQTWSSTTPRTPADAVTDPLFWVGLRMTNPATATAPLAVGIDRLLFNTALARTALTLRAPEILGKGTGEAFQVLPLAHRPLFHRPGLGDPYAHLVVEVGIGEPPAWTAWTRVDEIPPGPGTVYRLDPVTGEVMFGDHDERTGTGHGSVPPRGAEVRARTYRYVTAGAAGNVAPSSVVVLGTTLAGALPRAVTAVTNTGPGADGADEEPVEETLRRAPEELRIRDRAVTADDYEFLAREASREVAVCRALAPRVHARDDSAHTPPVWRAGDPWTYAGVVRAPGTVNLVVVPDQGASVARPEPTLDLLRDVRAFLEPRRDLTADLVVLRPRYLPVVVAVDLAVWQQGDLPVVDPAKLRDDVLARIAAFLHPTRGGPAGRGWEVGQAVTTADLYRALAPSQDVGYVTNLQVRPDVPAYHFAPLNPGGTAGNWDASLERPFPLAPFGASVRVADYELVCAAAEAAHQVKTTVAPV